jgi:hypothetical protein
MEKAPIIYSAIFFRRPVPSGTAKLARLPHPPGLWVLAPIAARI